MICSKNHHQVIYIKHFYFTLLDCILTAILQLSLFYSCHCFTVVTVLQLSLFYSCHCFTVVNDVQLWLFFTVVTVLQLSLLYCYPRNVFNLPLPNTFGFNNKGHFDSVDQNVKIQAWRTFNLKGFSFRFQNVPTLSIAAFNGLQVSTSPTF